jgi:GT2 family glycosyltransferase
MIGVTAVMVAYNNEERAALRLKRDLLPALRYTDAEVIVIDNSRCRSHRLEYAVQRAGGRYRWQRGANLRYSRAMNLAVSLATKPNLLYVCTEHGRSYDHTWALDLLAPLADESVAMTGTLYDSGPPGEHGFPDDLWNYHVQGGVFAARTAVMAANPYPDGDYAHYGSDIYLCFQLVQKGLRLVDVPTVRSVWWKADLSEGEWKYVHNSGRE